ncbi:hypothetical protein TSOC_012515 [Tetrabaena socialis]|uniref:Uncharacterized protein n=1 Tax=Tetrabaena socialis TaxID=47790 RepID=A0A2J7ZMU2_9CHLO|nr:hypothetical protein TSOC_012515 [Tetrabaena socialis]|eukprot:PNH01592.1 hypothetical protein TSOC_012515 [Tetrabaena socialis]
MPAFRIRSSITPLLALAFVAALVIVGVALFAFWMWSVGSVGGGLEGFGESIYMRRRIWTYWDGDPPLLVQLCLDSWRAHNPAWEITILSKRSLRDYVADVDLDALRHANDSQARFADFVRLHVLARYGGLWMDASVICQAPLDWIFDAFADETRREFVGYRADQHMRALGEQQGIRYEDVGEVLETSVFACVPGCAFVRMWRDEFMRINEYDSVDDYVSDVLASGTALPDQLAHSYYAIFASQIVVTRQNPGFLAAPAALLVDCTHTIFSYQFHLGDEDESPVAALRSGRFKDQPLLKLTNWERADIQDAYPDPSVFFDE